MGTFHDAGPHRVVGTGTEAIRGVLADLRDADPQLPVVMLPGNTDTALARRTLAQGAFDYIAKPFNVTRLAVARERGVRSRRGGAREALNGLARR
jgi:FixJ family two-component response regulator